MLIFFYCRPNQYNLNPPHAKIIGNEIQISKTVIGTDASLTKSYFYDQLNGIKQYLGWQDSTIETYNKNLSSFINEKLNVRIQKYLDTERSIQSLGIPLRNQPSSNTINPKVAAPKKSNINVTTAQSYDVALSFAGENRSYVERVAKLLKEKGIEVFYDDFEKGSLWGKNLVDHLADIYRNKSKYVVMFISEHYVSKAWPTHERQSAQARALIANNEYLLPVRFDDTMVPGLADTVSYIDLRSTTPENLVELVLAKLRK